MTRTNAHALLTVGLRLVAAYYLVTQLATVIGQFFFSQADVIDMARDFWVVNLGACLLFALLWLFADRVAGWGLASRTAPTFDSDIDAKLLLAIGIALLGIWAAAENFASLGYYGALKWSMTRPSAMLDDPNFSMEQRVEVFACTVELAVGVWMTLRAHGLARVIYKLRFAGTAQDRDDELKGKSEGRGDP